MHSASRQKRSDVIPAKELEDLILIIGATRPMTGITIPTRVGRSARAHGPTGAKCDGSRRDMSEQLHLLELVTGRLSSGGFDYMVTGSMAVTYYAEPRFTRDIDIVVEVGLDRAGAAVALFDRDFYIDADSLRAAIHRDGMVNLIHNVTLIKVDLIIRKNDDYHREEFRRRRWVDVSGARISIVSPEDLILSKLDWLKQGGSEIHRRDVLSVLEAVPHIDRDYLNRWAPSLSVADLWHQLSA